MSYAVAVDAGGTTTRGVVVASDGTCLGYGTSGRGNPVSAGAEVAAASVGEAVEAALTRACVPGEGVDAVVLTMAGGSTGPLDPLIERLRALGIGPPPVLKGDLLSSLCSGTPSLDGYAVIAGTGAGAARIVGGTMVAVADALGWLIGDGGSGFWIGHQVVRAAFAGLDGFGPRTALTGSLLRCLGVPFDEHRVAERPVARAEAVRRVYALRPVELSQFAHLAFEAGDDEVARGIVAAAASELARTLVAVADPAVRGPVVLAGGVFAHHPSFAASVRALAHDVPATAFTTVSDGAVGVAVLALRELGVTVEAPTHHRVASTLRDLVRRP